jgi:hypothetical protein
MTVPVLVREPVVAEGARAMPKSATYASPEAVIRTFCGFMSRWIKPLAWAAPRAPRHLVAERGRDPGVERAVLGDALFEGAAGDVFHRDVGEAIFGVPAVVDGDDVRVGEARRAPGLAPEAHG